MALNFNKVILAGRIATAPETKQTQSGATVCDFRLAVNRRAGKQADHPETDFFNVTAWSGTADFIGKYFTKGSAICITGRIQNRSYTDKEGKDRTITVIVAEEATFVESRNYTDPLAHPYEVAGQPVPTPAPSPAPAFTEVSMDDQLPF